MLCYCAKVLVYSTLRVRLRKLRAKIML